MNSRDYVEEIDLQKYWLVIKRRWIPASIVFGVVVVLAALFASSQKPIYQADGTVLVKASSTSTLTGLGEGLGEIDALDTQNSPLDTQVELVRSNSILQKVIARTNLVDSKGKPMKIEALSKALMVKGIAGTDVLRISYQSNDPQEAADVVNATIELFIQNNVEVNRAEAVSARKFIDEQLPATEIALQEADSNLRKFREKNNVIVLDEESKGAVEIITDLENQIAEAKAQLGDVTARLKELSRRVGVSPQQAVTYASLSQSSGVQEVLKQLQVAQQELAVEQTRYQRGHPKINNLERQIVGINALLQERVTQIVGETGQIPIEKLQLGSLEQTLISDLITTNTEQLGVASRLSALSNAQSIYKQRAGVFPGLEQMQRELERKSDVAQITYEALLAQLQEIQIAENQNVGNASIVSPALVPNTPVSLRKLLILAGGVAVGMLSGIAVAFALDLSDQSVKTLKQAKELFGYTLLGVIPTFSKQGTSSTYSRKLHNGVPRIIIRDAPRSPASQAYQMLRANLKFLSLDKVLRTIVITSSVAKEGKSEVSANLAAAIAQLGRRVLLVDADMRCPSQHHIWNLTNAAGLSHVIVNQVCLGAAVREVMPNLYVLPAGAIPPNPISLLDSQRMSALLDRFSIEYDFVIFDTPPLSGTADAAVLGRLADGILLIVRPDVVTFARTGAVKELLTQSRQNVLGIVVNGVNIKDEPDSYVYYSRSEPELEPLLPQSNLVN